MKNKLAVCCFPLVLGLLSVLIIATVNTLNPEHTYERVQGKVTRYHHTYGDIDAHKSLSGRIAVKMVDGLRSKEFKRYQWRNIILYVVCLPVFMSLLTIWAFWPIKRYSEVDE